MTEDSATYSGDAPNENPNSNSRGDAPTESVEQEIRRKGLTAPRVTPADIEANIAGEFYATLDEAFHQAPIPTSLCLTTLCVLQLRNGYTVIGTSACASPENFNAELGRRIARENAVREIWPLMGYALRERLQSP